MKQQNTYKLNDWDVKQKQNIYYVYEIIYMLKKEKKVFNYNKSYLQIHGM